MTKVFYLYGERCSGTNVVERLVEQNFGLHVSWEYGYKHWPEMTTDWSALDGPIVIVTRNPIGYFSSLFRKPWHAPDEIKQLELSEFLRSSWWNVYNEEVGVSSGDPRYNQPMERELDPETGQRFKNVIQMRTSRLRALRRIFESKDTGIVHVRFEELQGDQYTVVNRISNDCGIELIHYKPKRVLDYKGNVGWKRKLYNRVIFSHIWKNYKRPVSYSAEDLAFIKNELDPELEKYWGYCWDSIF